MTIAKDKITEIFCMADDFCQVYDRFIKINGLAPKRDKSKRKYHRDSTLSDWDSQEPINRKGLWLMPQPLFV